MHISSPRLPPPLPHDATRRPRFIFYFLLLLLVAIGVMFKVTDILLETDTDRLEYNYGRNFFILSKSFRTSSSSETNGNRSKLQKSTVACAIPQLDPYDKSIIHLVNETPPVIDCEKAFPLLFNSTWNSTVIPAKGYEPFREHNLTSCCYRTVERIHEPRHPDNGEKISSECFRLSLKSETKIPVGHEFIAIYCQKEGNSTLRMMDVHAFVPLKTRKGASDPIPSQAEGETDPPKFNVITIGLDSVSRVHFQRAMPKTYSYIKKHLDPVEMMGYNKVSDSTFENLIPLWTSKSHRELGCAAAGSNHINDCPFIWKEFSKEGYYTSYSEDGPIIGTFNYARIGFVEQPTDYYLRPIVRVAHSNIGSNKYRIATCYGPRLSFQFLLDYVEKLAHTMVENKKRFFLWTWAGALFHDFLNPSRYGDIHLLNYLKRLKESGYLDDTILILMSDHGQRMDAIRRTIQGQLEDRLPFMFLMLPDKLKRKYPMAYRNLQSNVARLVTTFDVHETLKDILNLGKLQEEILAQRQVHLSQLGKSLPRGISLFLPIPEFRTCEMAGIDMNFCSCNNLVLANLTHPDIKTVAEVGVTYINFILKGTSQCPQLKLNNVTMAQYSGDRGWEVYLVTFETSPGGGLFEALATRNRKNENWGLKGSVPRANLYGNQSHCVQEKTLKPYCYCL